MKKILLIAAVALTACIGANAQTNSKNNSSEQKGQKMDETEMIQMRTNQMVKKYGLDESQAASLLTLNKKYAGKMGPGMGGPKGERPTGDKSGMAEKSGKSSKASGTQEHKGNRPEMTDAQKKEMEANRTAYETELKSIMTDEQFKSYQADAKKGPQGARNSSDKKSKETSKNTAE